MTEQLSTVYEPKAIEAQANDIWLRGNHFHADASSDAKAYTIVIPPPNVTAPLHLGHALNNSLQDILIRFKRMQGFNTLWMPGTDHAGIATQTVVEKRLLAEQGKRRTDFERAEFVGHVQAWKDQYEAQIIEQLKSMGCSCDWGRTRFTMDEVCAKAVRTNFFNLFKDGLIYRGKRLVNWDPATQTVLADDEVEHKKVAGFFWYLQYPLADGSGHVTVATTRPETMLGDTAVAMNPTDPRAEALVGKMVRLPIVGREIPIIADEHVVLPNPESEDEKARFSTGFLKVTPAHDPDDWAIGQRHDLEVINVMAPDASISDKHGWDDCTEPEAQALLGMDRYEAREAIVEWFRGEKLLEEVREYAHEIGHSYRSHVAIEPYLSDQWYIAIKKEIPHLAEEFGEGNIDGTDVPANSLAGLALAPLLDGRLKFTPERYAKTYQVWLENLRDWPISRQLWWGHQIPVWTLVLTTAHCQGENELDDAYIEKDLKLLDDFLNACDIKNDVNYYKSERLIDGFYPYYICAKSPKAQRALDLLSRISLHHSTSDTKLVKKFKVDNDEFKELFGEKAFKAANEIRPKIISLTRDEDVLDTWFSSALWPFSTMGWPDETAEMDKYYPGDVLCTAREIITLWVSRMVMMGQYCVGDIPFKDVYIHAMIQDGKGRKMSKSLGNGIDPLVAIDSHGADAMRFTLASMTTDTQDVRMPVAPMELPDGRVVNTSPKFDIGRNFCNKLWNASRFAMMNLEGTDAEKFDAAKMTVSDKWILSRLANTVRDVTGELDSYKFNEPLSAIYRFFWNDLCDWYLEWAKPRMSDEAERPIAQNVLAFVLDQTLRLLHPFVPFITEGIFQKLNDIVPVRKLAGLAEAKASEALIVASWPEGLEKLIDAEIEKDICKIQNVIKSIREIRNQYNIAPSKKLIASANAPKVTAGVLKSNAELICNLAGLDEFIVEAAVEKPQNAATALVDETEVFVHDVIDPEAERKRLKKQKQQIENGLRGVRGKLNNENFVTRAKPEVVTQAREKLKELTEQVETIEKHLSELKNRSI